MPPTKQMKMSYASYKKNHIGKAHSTRKVPTDKKRLQKMVFAKDKKTIYAIHSPAARDITGYVIGKRVYAKAGNADRKTSNKLQKGDHGSQNIIARIFS